MYTNMGTSCYLISTGYLSSFVKWRLCQDPLQISCMLIIFNVLKGKLYKQIKCHGLGKVKSNGRCYKSTWVWPIFESSLWDFFLGERICIFFSVKLIAQAELKQKASLPTDCRPGVRTKQFTLGEAVPSSPLAPSRALFLGFTPSPQSFVQSEHTVKGHPGLCRSEQRGAL